MSFGATAPRLYDVGLSPIPLGKPGSGEQSKGASVKGWQKFARDRYDRTTLNKFASNFTDHNIGLGMGTIVKDGLQLIAVDIDYDEILTRIERAMPALVSGKVGAKGATWFALAPESWKSRRIQVEVNSEKRMGVEILANGAQVAIPPSIHPKTGEPYKWLGKSLLEISLGDLPVLTDGFMLEIAAISRERDQYFNGGVIHDGTPDQMNISGINNMSWAGPGGGGDTHDERLRCVGYMVATGWSDEDILNRLRRSMYEAYARSGNTPAMDFDIVESDNKSFLESARAKSYDTTSKHGKSSGKVPKERIYAEWAMEALAPIVHTGTEFRRYLEGYWQPISPEKVEQIILNQDRTLKKADSANAVAVMSRLLLDPHFFNTQPQSVCLKTGTLDVSTGLVRPWREEDRLLFQLDIDWEPEMTCPNYDMVVKSAFNNCQKSVDTYEEFCGLTLIDEMKFQKALFIVGPGQTGKSTMAAILESMHPSESLSSIPITELHDIRMKTQLFNKMVNMSSEQSRMNVISDVEFKKITGGDPVTVRFLYEEAQSVRMKVRFFSISNDLPTNNDVSFAMKRRLIILNTPNSITNPDLDLGLKLHNERPAILNRWVKALRRLMDRGRFDPPASSDALVAEYITENSTAQLWVNERTEPAEADERAILDDVYADFKDWLTQSGYKYPVTKHSFKKQLINLGHKIENRNLIAGKVTYLVDLVPFKIKPGMNTRRLMDRV